MDEKLKSLYKEVQKDRWLRNTAAAVIAASPFSYGVGKLVYSFPKVNKATTIVSTAIPYVVGTLAFRHYLDKKDKNKLINQLNNLKTKKDIQSFINNEYNKNKLLYVVSNYMRNPSFDMSSLDTIINNYNIKYNRLKNIYK